MSVTTEPGSLGPRTTPFTHALRLGADVAAILGRHFARRDLARTDVFRGAGTADYVVERVGSVARAMVVIHDSAAAKHYRFTLRGATFQRHAPDGSIDVVAYVRYAQWEVQNG